MTILYKVVNTVLLIFLLALAQNVTAQNLLYVHSNSDKGLYLVNLDDCSSKLIGYLPETMYDIALSPDGQLYGISTSRAVYLLDKQTARGRSIGTMPSLLNALVYGADDKLYGADGNGNIYKINPNNATYQYLGNCGYGSGGDLTFLEGSLYLAASGGQLIKIDLNQPARSINLGTMAGSNIFGIITVGSTDCNGEKPQMYAIGNNIIYEISLSTGSPILQIKCSLNINSIGGAASSAEASKIQRKNAGKDSTLLVCNRAVGVTNLQYYLPNIEQSGKWEDVDKSGALQGSIVNNQSLNEGIYKFRYILGETLCADTSIISIRVIKLRIAKLDVKNSSCSVSDGEISVTIGNNPTGTLYLINSQSYQLYNQFKNLKPDKYIIKVRTLDGCETDTSIILNTSTAPQILNVKIQSPKCGKADGELEVISIGGTGSLFYSIDGTNFSEKALFKNISAKKYTVTVKDVNNCSSSKDFQILQTYGPVISNTNVISTSCGQSNGVISVTTTGGTAPIRFSIDSLRFQRNSSFTFLGAGIYRIVAVDSVGCTSGATLKIESSVSPKIDSLKAVKAECGEKNGSVVVYATGLLPLTYSLDSTKFQNQSSFTNLASSTYLIFIKDDQGCQIQTKLIVENNCSQAIYIPTAFTPNNDKQNDTWTAYFQQSRLNVLVLTIFNRWGETVYSRENFQLLSGDMLWDGSVKEKSSESIFTYKLEVQFDNGGRYVYLGSVYSIK